MEHSFQINDIVKYKNKNRHNGTIKHICCGTCNQCTLKKYDDCISSVKNKICVSWPDKTRLNRYEFSDLEMEGAPDAIVKMDIVYPEEVVSLINVKIADLPEIERDIPIIAEEIEAPPTIINTPVRIRVSDGEIRNDDNDEKSHQKTAPASWEYLTAYSRLGVPV